MPTRDIIEISLNAPIDWLHFERLVCEILEQDDLPRLRHYGGVGDQGADGAQEAFFQGEMQTDVVVQVTSEKAEVQKFRKTVQRLRDTGLRFNRLVVVYRYPVSSSARATMQSEALTGGFAADIRDQDYLIAQLAKPGSTVYARHFQGVREQVAKLFEDSDPLRLATDRVRHAVLASVGAYVINPRAPLARRTLFEKTVLAAVASSPNPVTMSALRGLLLELMPAESIEDQQISAAIAGLLASGACEQHGDGVLASEQTLSELGAVLSSTRLAYDTLLRYVLEACSRGTALDDATRGALERNLRRAVLALLRQFGPVDFSTTVPEALSQSNGDILAILCRDIPDAVGRRALFALTSFLEDSEKRDTLATLARSYAALAIRNIDPLGRRWQAAIMARTRIALDTDAVLHLLIEELPENSSLKQAFGAFRRVGVSIVVCEGVLAEAAVHITRAAKTHSRFAASLDRMSGPMVDGDVWNAVVRGFYYARKHNPATQWHEYWHKYLEPGAEVEYVKFLLKNRVDYQVADLSEFPQDWLGDLEAIAATLLASKEVSRRKAVFRDPEQMRDRTLADVRMALSMAVPPNLTEPTRARGYVASEDRAFLLMEAHAAWGHRQRVFVNTRSLPQLAEFTCAEMVPDDIIVRLLFDPVIAVAAHLMDDQIRTLTAVGIDLKQIPLDRLEWDLAGKLRSLSVALRTSPEGFAEPEVDSLASELARIQDNGYPLDPRVSAAIAQLEEANRLLEVERRGRLTAEAALKNVAEVGVGQSRKARQRFARALREVGVDPDELLEVPQSED